MEITSGKHKWKDPSSGKGFEWKRFSGRVPVEKVSGGKSLPVEGDNSKLTGRKTGLGRTTGKNDDRNSWKAIFPTKLEFQQLLRSIGKSLVSWNWKNRPLVLEIPENWKSLLENHVVVVLIQA